MNLIEKVVAFCNRHALLAYGDRILLAVSGGLDSVAMLYLFRELQPSQSYELAVLHVNHGIRGAAADKDCDFVAGLAQQFTTPFFARKVDALKYQQENKRSLEESARELRYQVYQELLDNQAFDKLAIAHTADDQAETVIDHVLRGSGIRGLRGMLPVRGPFIRPLLATTRAELETYVESKNLSYRYDSSNSALRYKRNRIRHELLPGLKNDYNDNIVATLNHAATLFAEAESYLEYQAREAYKSLVSLQKKNEIVLEIEAFLRYFYVIQKYVLLHASVLLGVERKKFDYFRLQQAIDIIGQKKIGSKAVVMPDIEIMVDHDGLVFRRPVDCSPKKMPIDVSVEGRLRYFDYELSWCFTDRDDIRFVQDKRVEFIDSDKAGTTLFLRTMRPGDRFVPLNLKGSKKVADFFSDRKVPLHLRETIPILENPDEIVWVCGFRIDDRYKVRETTRRVIKLEINELTDGV